MSLPITLIVLWAVLFHSTGALHVAELTPQSKHFHTMRAQSLRRDDTAKCQDSSSSGSPPKGQQEAKAALRLDHVRRPCATDTKWETFVKEALERETDAASLETMLVRRSKATGLPVKNGRTLRTGNYISTIGFGTPPHGYQLVIDTGSDITWMQCLPCSTNSSCYAQTDPLFDPKASSSYSPLACSSDLCKELSSTEEIESCTSGTCRYEVHYGDGSQTAGDFVQETIRVGKKAVRRFPFGCGHQNSGLFRGAAGILGLGRGSLAFPKRTASVYKGQFSYCLPDYLDADAGGALTFGLGSIPRKAVFTPMLTTEPPTPYYVAGLTAISVGRFVISMPETASVVDSGTVISRLTPDLYDALSYAFRNQTADLPTAPSYLILDTCYDLSKRQEVSVPKILFHYRGNATVEVNAAGLLLPVKANLSQVCLAFSSVRSNFNIIGNYQQQRTLVGYDNLRGNIAFAPRQCSAPGRR
eukprot:TRINITY_DN5434_c0_g1_i1.p1 TRINITY_DN5434_c0_g1~~TRINITY_DN5434_c0_g1_i1.p1  ORF type:complete len:472 (-),score=-41.67 TRINITY_DN5434_c0_g1_i1:298-1713(-)